ncbi:MAG: type II toxin-antitoxin system VapC family toxin [Neisseriaceae bacterium]|nr:type II toxin-antitoxin system VapC family toxin [Neisseriaceae bacterium]
MNISIDTNVLVRFVLQDDPVQMEIANDLLEQASSIAIPLPCLCEMVWILQRGAKLPKYKLIEVLENILAIQNVILNRPAVEQGLKLLKMGGDFADGVMEYEGSILGGEVFCSFDKKAVKLLQEQGKSVKLLG